MRPGKAWELIEGKYEPVYVIKYAYSPDGICWVPPPTVYIKLNNELGAYSRPSVVKDGDTYKMWYSYRDNLDFRGGRGSTGWVMRNPSTAPTGSARTTASSCKARPEIGRKRCNAIPA